MSTKPGPLVAPGSPGPPLPRGCCSPDSLFYLRRHYNWAVAAPMILSLQAFQRNLPKVMVRAPPGLLRKVGPATGPWAKKWRVGRDGPGAERGN